jgi:HAD superfamily hydrolase (TIGR01509 family)
MKAYIFDLDGTLLDSMMVWHDVDAMFCKKRGLVKPDDYGTVISAMSFPEVAAYTIKLFNLPDSAESLMREWHDMAAFTYKNKVQLKPHAKEYLTELRKHGAKLAIATSSVPGLYEPTLRTHGIYDWFDVICNASEAGYGKSRPDIFVLTAKKLGVPPEECIMFDDLLAAVKCAKSIGMTAYGVYDKSSESDWEEIKKTADGFITDFSDAPLFKYS